MKFMNALEQAREHNRLLWYTLLGSFLLNAVIIFGWIHSQTKIKVMIPPQIPQSGLTITQGKIPKSSVYSFALYIWQNINHWPDNGMRDYKEQINNFSNFITPNFKLALIKNYNNLLNEGELQDRIRLLQTVNDKGFNRHSVTYLGAGSWLVKLNSHLTELMNINGKVVKDIKMHYFLKVVRYNISGKDNPWGLAIAGFYQSPIRSKTII